MDITADHKEREEIYRACIDLKEAIEQDTESMKKNCELYKQHLFCGLLCSR